jgi:flavorubredoxin
MLKAHEVAPDTFVIPTPHEVPGRGLLFVNSIVIRGEEPVLIDTTQPVSRDAWTNMVFELVDPKAVRWIFLTHDDRDHSGNVMQALSMCPNATLVTNFIGVGKLGYEMQIPIERVRFMNDGESFDIGDRTLVAVRPPLFDAPGTRGVYDAKTGVYFAADAFGASVPHECERVDDVPFDVWLEGFNWFNRANHSWHELADPIRVDMEIDKLRALEPEVIVSGHGPTAIGRSRQMFDLIARIPRMKKLPEVTQRDLEEMLTGGANAAPPPPDGGAEEGAPA